MASYVAAIDQGTSSSRVILYKVDPSTHTFTPTASAQEELTIKASKPGWAQTCPNEILASVKNTAATAMLELGASVDEIKGIGITNQRESLVVWDKNTGEPLYDAILWLDARTAETSQMLEDELGGKDALRDACGLPLSTYFTGVKLRWLIDEEPRIKAKLEAGEALVGTVDSWLVWKLSGGAAHVTDVTNASRTMLMSLADTTWNPDAIKALGVEAARNSLPTIVSCAEEVAVVDGNACPALAGVPITGIIGDQQAAMVGQRCLEAGMAKTTFGTGAFTLINTADTPAPSTTGLLTTVLYKMGPEATTQYALEGAVGSCAVGLNWFVNSLGMFSSAPDITATAATVESSEGLYFVPAFGGILAPRWRDDARGTLVGLTLAHDRGHVARASLEGIAFQVKDVADAMAVDSGVPVATLRVDGGVAKSDVMLQTQANLLNVNVERPNNVETTALGAAYASGIGAGLVTLGDLRGEKDVETTFTPQMTQDERDKKCSGWERAIASSLDWAEK